MAGTEHHLTPRVRKTAEVLLAVTGIEPERELRRGVPKQRLRLLHVGACLDDVCSLPNRPPPKSVKGLEKLPQTQGWPSPTEGRSHDRGIEEGRRGLSGAPTSGRVRGRDGGTAGHKECLQASSVSPRGPSRSPAVGRTKPAPVASGDEDLPGDLHARRPGLIGGDTSNTSGGAPWCLGGAGGGW